MLIRNKKATIGTTLIWVLGVFLIAILSLIVLSLIIAIAKSSKSESETLKVFPEKGYILYSILNKKTAGIRMDEKIISAGKIEDTSILKKIPSSNINFYWAITLSNKEIANELIKNNNYLKPENIVLFPVSSKGNGINVNLYYAEYSPGI